MSTTASDMLFGRILPGQRTSELRQVVQKQFVMEILLCCPEDVPQTQKCKHADHFVCHNCRIPICFGCLDLLSKDQGIPKPLSNDNLFSYAHRFTVHEFVMRLEATVACPIFSGLTTFSTEGKASERGHLMEKSVAQSQKKASRKKTLRLVEISSHRCSNGKA